MASEELRQNIPFTLKEGKSAVMGASAVASVALASRSQAVPPMANSPPLPR